MSEGFEEIDFSARFWSRTERRGASECWPWVGSKNHQGYGRLEIKNKAFLAHRLSYMVNVGVIPDGMVIDHRCCNKGCVNPSHLEAVTHSVNCRRRDNNAIRKSRSAS